MARALFWLVMFWLMLGVHSGLGAAEEGGALDKTSDPASRATQPVTRRVAEIRISGRMAERPALFELMGSRTDTLWSYVQRLEKARSNSGIHAVALVLEMPVMGYAQACELADAVSAVRASGKPVYLYGSMMTLPGYVRRALYVQRWQGGRHRYN